MFILADFIEVAQALHSIRLLCGQGTPVIEGKTESIHKDASVKDSIQKLLNILVGTTRGAPAPFRWNSFDGFLPKLRNYCILFHQKIDGAEKDSLTFQYYAEKIFTECLHALDALLQDDRTTFLKNIEKAEGALQRLAKVLARQVADFSDDENVVFFVAKNREKLDKIYGNRFVAKMLSRMYPKGLRDAQAFLVKRYLDRGFEQLLPEITKKMAELEASM
jgi:hypothetical protein